MKSTKLKQFVSMAVVVLFITAFGIVLLHYDNALPEISDESTAVESATKQPVLEGSVNASEDMYIDGRLNINQAGLAELDALPGIGRVLAERIIAYRAEKPFKVTRDLKKVSGIGDKTYKELEDLVCVALKD